MSIQNELNGLFGRTWGGGEETGGAGAWVPALDDFETKDTYVVTVELPGIEPEDVEREEAKLCRILVKAKA